MRTCVGFRRPSQQSRQTAATVITSGAMGRKDAARHASKEGALPGSHLRALEAANSALRIIRHELPALGAGLVRGDGRAVKAHSLTKVLPLGQRCGLLCARRRHDEPSRRAPDCAASNKNQGDSNTAGIHDLDVARDSGSRQVKRPLHACWCRGAGGGAPREAQSCQGAPCRPLARGGPSLSDGVLGGTPSAQAGRAGACGGRQVATQALAAVQTDAPRSRAADVHSFRRAFNTGLGAAGVNVQQAMALAGHKDARTHLLYVQLAQRGTLTTPAAALPTKGVLPMLWDKTPSLMPASNDEVAFFTGDPNENRTRVIGVRGRRPNR